MAKLSIGMKVKLQSTNLITEGNKIDTFGWVRKGHCPDDVPVKAL